ncbi:unnamed protein product [Lathyrus oleraceus]
MISNKFVIRNNEGTWIKDFAKSIGKCRSPIAKLWGICDGIIMAKSASYSQVEIQTNSVEAFNTITKKKTTLLEGTRLVSQIKEALKQENIEVRVIHVYKETNKCVNGMTKSGENFQNEKYIFDKCTREVNDVFVMGIIRSSSRRKIIV